MINTNRNLLMQGVDIFEKQRENLAVHKLHYISLSDTKQNVSLSRFIISTVTKVEDICKNSFYFGLPRNEWHYLDTSLQKLNQVVLILSINNRFVIIDLYTDSRNINLRFAWNCFTAGWAFISSEFSCALNKKSFLRKTIFDILTLNRFWNVFLYRTPMKWF